LCGRACKTVSNDLTTSNVTITFNNGMGVTLFKGFFGKKCGMNATIDDPGSPFTGDAAYFIAAEGVARMVVVHSVENWEAEVANNRHLQETEWTITIMLD
jgi:hypothetical protein